MQSPTDPSQQPRHVSEYTKPQHLRSIFLSEPGCPERSQLENLVADKFARAHGARIDAFLPYLIGLGAPEETVAIAGLRFASDSPLFLEQYLERPIEQAISQAFRVPVDRGQIVEIGNLVSIKTGAASALFALLPLLLRGAGIRWVACSATPTVRALLTGLEFPSRTIADANPGALADGAGNWGRYYESRPLVIAGKVGDALRRAQDNKLLASIGQGQAQQLSHIAERLRATRT